MAGETVYWEDLKEGDEIPDFPCEFSASKLFQLSAVTQNVHRIHYDRDWAEHEGYEERVIHGPFHGEVIIQTLEELGRDHRLGEEGRVLETGATRW